MSHKHCAYTGQVAYDVFLWLCEEGHHCAVSDLVMRYAIAEPRCTVRVDKHCCGARLRRRVGVLEGTDQ